MMSRATPRFDSLPQREISRPFASPAASTFASRQQSCRLNTAAPFRPRHMPTITPGEQIGSATSSPRHARLAARPDGHRNILPIEAWFSP